MNRQKRFRELFRFLKIFDRKDRKSGVRVVNDYSLDTDVFKFFNYIGCVNTPKYLFLPDCSFKICEKPSKFSRSVTVVVDYGDTVSA